jgi:hypothetical protein
MPRLLYSSETKGCGATIQLDSQEICIISVAQTGVLVRSYRDGFLSHLWGSFLGPLLYKEQNVYKATKTAMALAVLFPDEVIQLQFKNPVLSAFAKAVWQCSEAGRVAILLNEVTGRPETDDPIKPTTPITIQSSASDAKIIRDFGGFVECDPPRPDRIEDVSKLPHPKDVILTALLNEIRKGNHPEKVTNALCGLATCLSQFQSGVGEMAVEALGINFNDLPDKKDLDAIAAAITDASDAQERFKQFVALVELDERRIDAAIALAKTHARQQRLHSKGPR